MRLFDLVLAILVLLAIVFIARREFPGYAGRSYAPVAPVAANSPESAASPAPAATP